MAKHLIKGFLCQTTYQFDALPFEARSFVDFRRFKPSGEYDKGTALIREHQFEVDVPDDFDPRPALIENLRAIEKKAMADFQLKVTEIRRQISELEAIEHTA